MHATSFNVLRSRSWETATRARLRIGFLQIGVLRVLKIERKRRMDFVIVMFRITNEVDVEVFVTLQQLVNGKDYGRTNS